MRSTINSEACVQNERTLIDLGFKKLSRSNEWLYRGNYQKFIAVIRDPDCRVYVSLYRVTKIVDNRPLSENKGRYFRHIIKDCTSNNSVANAINHYDVPDAKITDYIGGCVIK